MVYCPDCGRNNPDNADVCAYCGAQIHPWESSTNETVNDRGQEREQEIERIEKDNGHSKVLLLGVIVIVAIVVIVGLLALGGVFSGNDGESTPSVVQPDADLTASSTSGYAPLDVTFSLSASDTNGSIVSWELYIDNDWSADYTGSGAPPPTKQHTYQNPGTYTALLKVTDNDGTNDSATVTIEVSETQKVSASFDYTPKNPTTNDIIQFTDTSTSTEGHIASCFWEFDASKEYTNETSNVDNPTYRYQYGYGKTFPVKLTVTDSGGNSDSITKRITIAHQSDVPQGDDISLEVLNHERKDTDLKGEGHPLEGYTCVWVTVKLTNNWNNDIIPMWSFDRSPYWGDHFYIYVNYDPEDWWGYSEISPEEAPEKIAPGESFTWTINFWIPNSEEEYMVEFAYYYDWGDELKEQTFSTLL